MDEELQDIYILVGLNNRVLDWSSTSGGNRINIKIESTHEFLNNPSVFTYDSGVLTKDVEYQQQLIDAAIQKNNQPTEKELIEQLQVENEKLKNDNLVMMEAIAEIYEMNLT